MQNFFIDILEKHGVKHEVRGEEVWYQCPLPGHNNEDKNFSASYSIRKNVCNCFVHGGGLYKLLMFLEGKEYKEIYDLVEKNKPQIERNKVKLECSRIPDEFKRNKINGKELGKRINSGLVERYKKQIYKPYTFENFTSNPKLIKLFEIGFDIKSKRVTIPVRDEKGKLIFVIKRSILQNTKYRYLNEPKDSEKSNYVYGLNLWDNPDYLIVVEGPKSVIRCVDKGLINVVSIMGSKPSERQLKLLSSKTNKIYSALDNDEAGKLGLKIFKKNHLMFVDGVYIFKHPKITKEEILKNKFRDMADYTVEELKYGIENSVKYNRGMDYVWKK